MRKGEIMSEKLKEKIRFSNLGKKRSEETKRKIGLSKKGVIFTHRFGNTYTKGSKNVNYGKFGKNHPCWKENKKRPFLKSIRQLFEYRQWRSDIFSRDKFTCTICNIKYCSLQADHYPKKFIDIIYEYQIDTLDKAISCEELWNINNGRTLCVPCHLKTDTWGKKRKLTKS